MTDKIKTWLKLGGVIEITWHEPTHLYYAEFNPDKPPPDRDTCGSGKTPVEALESLIEDVNEPRES